jgi:hypothetical protein
MVLLLSAVLPVAGAFHLTWPAILVLAVVVVARLLWRRR